MRSNTKKKIAPVVAAIVVVAALLPILLMMLGIIGLAGGEAEGAMLVVTLPVLGIYILAVGAIIVGVVIAMYQRLKEIDGGEEDEARKY